MGRLAAAREVTVGVTSVRDAGAHPEPSPVAATRDGASDSAAPGAPARSPEASSATGRLPVQGHPAAGARRAGAPGGSARAATSGSSHPRGSQSREGGPRRSEFRLFVTPSSLVFVPRLGSGQLEFLSTLCPWSSQSGDLVFNLCFLTLLWFGARMSHWLLDHLCVFPPLPMLCSCFSPSQLGLFRQGGPCLDL